MLDFRGLVESALQALEQDRPADAEQSIRAALAMNPRDDQLLHLLGVSLIRQSREEEAIEPLQKAISLNRRDAEYHNAFGVALRNSGRVAEGIESMLRALKFEPGLQDAHYNLGQGYQRLGELAKAEEKFRLLQARNPRCRGHRGPVELHWFLVDHDSHCAICARASRESGNGDILFCSATRCSRSVVREGWYQYLWSVNRHAF